MKEAARRLWHGNRNRAGSQKPERDSYAPSSSVDARQACLIARENRVRLQRAERRAHQELLEWCYHQAVTKITADSLTPLLQGRAALAGLMLVQCLRAGTWFAGLGPASAMISLHWLAAASDSVTLGVAMPWFFCQTIDGWVAGGRAGLILTLVFAFCCADAGALLAYACLGSRTAFGPGRLTVLRVAEAYLDVWECTLVASAALHVVLLVAVWRIYGQLRHHGLYPVGMPPRGFESATPIQPVSMCEVLCESEDIDKMKQTTACCAEASPGAIRGLDVDEHEAIEVDP